MKLVLLLSLLPVSLLSFAQKYNFSGTYSYAGKTSANKGDTINEVFIFSDSFIHKYSIVQDKKEPPLSYEHRGKWSIYDQVKMEHTDDVTNKKHYFERLYTALDGGYRYGYFEYAAAAYDYAYKDPEPLGLYQMCFVKDGKIFTKPGTPPAPKK